MDIKILGIVKDGEIYIPIRDLILWLYRNRDELTEVGASDCLYRIINTLEDLQKQ